MALAAPTTLAPIRHTTRPLPAVLPRLYGNLSLALVANGGQWSRSDALDGAGFVVIHQMGSLLQLLWLYHHRGTLSSSISTWSRLDAPGHLLDAADYVRALS